MSSILSTQTIIIRDLITHVLLIARIQSHERKEGGFRIMSDVQRALSNIIYTFVADRNVYITGAYNCPLNQ